MIKLRRLLESLLKETPDVLAIPADKSPTGFDEEFRFIDEKPTTFFYLDFKGKTGIVYCEYPYDYCKSTNPEVNKKMKEVQDTYFLDTGTSDFFSWFGEPTHANVFEFLENAGYVPHVHEPRDWMSGRGWIQGRLWKFKGNTYASFWNSAEELKANKSIVTDIVDKLGGDGGAKNAYYNVTSRSGMRLDFENLFTYDEIFGSDTSDKPLEKKDFEKALLKIQHLAPEAKKALMRGPYNKKAEIADKLGFKSVAELDFMLKQGLDESFLKEDPDGIEVFGKYVKYDDLNEVVATVMIPKHLYIKYKSKIISNGKGWIAGDPSTNEIWINGKLMDFTAESTYGCVEHGSLQFSVSENIRMSEGGEIEMSRKDSVDARIFKVKGYYYISFWQTQEEVKKYKEQVIDLIKFFAKDEDPSLINLQFRGMRRNEFTTLSLFDNNVKKTVSDEESDLIRKIHLMKPEQKGKLLKKLGALSPNYLQNIADELGITPIELKQLLGKDIAENK